MSNKYLDKIASMTGDVLRGSVSPAWQENNIAKQHGKEGLKGAGANVGKHLSGTLRSGGRGVAEGVAGGVAGGALGHLAGRLAGRSAAGATVGALAGAYGGQIHGVVKSLKNQANEAHEKYSKK